VKPLFANTNYLAHWAGDLDLGPKALPGAPVTCVSWHAARAFAAWRGKRLPTTAEWEYAAAASANRADGEKDPAFRAELLRWFSTPSPALLPEAGQGRPNFFGIHDLHGLVFEWPADFNNFIVTGESRGDTSLERNLFCGSGSQGVKDTSNYPAFMRYAFRSSLQSQYAVHNLGIRCAKNLPPL
jgi:formylglycine-generating enzyme required for sulfatase activity